MPRSSGELRDLRVILAVQAIRAFLYGFGTVLLGTVFARERLSAVQATTVFTSMLIGMALVSVVVGLIGERVGRRRAYLVLLAVMGAVGAVFALTDWLPALIAVSLTGAISTDPNESGPITSLEQAMMGQAPTDARARVFGRYNAVAYLAGAVGALAAGGPAALRALFPLIPSDQRWLLVFPVLALICVVLASRLSPDVESGTEPARRPLQRSVKQVRRLAALFALDSLAGGFVVQTFLVYWFHRRFGASTELMGLVFFGAGLLQAGSSIASGRIAERIGFLNTMVFTHLPSNVLLLLVSFMPSLGLAIAMLLARFALSQMDVPARQAYVVAMVDPPERTAAAAFTNTARYVARPFGALAAGSAMQRIAIGAPFFVAGGLKILYDIVIFATFRGVRFPDGADRSVRRVGTG